VITQAHHPVREMLLVPLIQSRLHFQPMVENALGIRIMIIHRMMIMINLLNHQIRAFSPTANPKFGLVAHFASATLKNIALADGTHAPLIVLVIFLGSSKLEGTLLTKIHLLITCREHILRCHVIYHCQRCGCEFKNAELLNDHYQATEPCDKKNMYLKVSLRKNTSN
jgi:hypothetical protein